MDRKGLAIMILAAVILLLLFAPKRSGYGSGQATGLMGFNLSQGPTQGSMSYPNISNINRFKAGEGAPFDGPADSVDVVSATSLIPRDVVATEDFGQFSPDKILGNQNYLDPRSQIGYPETLGGVLRNANRSERSEPLNPRTPVSIFNLSTIPPDVMRPKFEITPEYN
jgi:hypothetical protein